MATQNEVLQVAVNETHDERLGGPNKCGRKFLEYWMSPERKELQCKTATDCAKHIPTVDIKFKIYRLSDFDAVGGTIFATFIVALDWEDPSLSLAENDIPDFYEHFWPKPELLNVSKTDLNKTQ
jgi:hypothetical protein